MGLVELTLELFIFLMTFFILGAVAMSKRIEKNKKLGSLTRENEVLDLLKPRNKTPKGGHLLTGLRMKAK